MLGHLSETLWKSWVISSYIFVCMCVVVVIFSSGGNFLAQTTFCSFFFLLFFGGGFQYSYVLLLTMCFCSQPFQQQILQVIVLVESKPQMPDHTACCILWYCNFCVGKMLVFLLSLQWHKNHNSQFHKPKLFYICFKACIYVKLCFGFKKPHKHT